MARGAKKTTKIPFVQSANEEHSGTKKLHVGESMTLSLAQILVTVGFGF